MIDCHQLVRQGKEELVEATSKCISHKLTQPVMKAWTESLRIHPIGIFLTRGTGVSLAYIVHCVYL